jgi:hypothetical protein
VGGAGVQLKLEAQQIPNVSHCVHVLPVVALQVLDLPLPLPTPWLVHLPVRPLALPRAVVWTTTGSAGLVEWGVVGRGDQSLADV